MLLDHSPHTDPPLHLMMTLAQIAPDRAPDLVARLPERDLTIALVLHAPDPRAPVRYLVASADTGDAPVAFTWQSAKTRRTIAGRPMPRWARYAAGVVLGIDIPSGTPGGDGFTAALAGSEPVGPRYEFAVGLLVAAVLLTWAQGDAKASAVMAAAERVRRDYVDG